jgi:hypothetical protein
MCRNCGSKNLVSVLDLGYVYPTLFVNRNSPPAEEMLRLSLCECEECNLVQNEYSYNPDAFYRQYYYKSSLNKSMLRDLFDVEKDIERRVDLTGAVVIDIGANDGSLLGFFPIDTYRVGYDPALNLKEEASKKCEIYINDYFSAKAYPLKRKAKSISAIACFYDISTPNQFVKEVKSILHKNGIFTVQFTDLYSMVTLNAFDSVCSEHVMQYSFKVLKNILEQNGLEVFDCSRNDVNGGSIRVFAGFPSRHEISENVENMLIEEEAYFSNCKEHPLVEMMKRVDEEKSKLLEFLYTVTKHGKRVYISGASTKGVTLLQVYGINSTLIPIALEVNEDKFGKLISNTGIEIVSEKDGLSLSPDYLLCPIWHFEKNLVQVYKEFISNGGSLIFPLPTFHIINKDNK